ncbi:MAG TPA: hypothetical protein VNZ61_18875 [Roseomonas sp.]|nr:hypothetical protein [Roseomonas sp.]
MQRSLTGLVQTYAAAEIDNAGTHEGADLLLLQAAEVRSPQEAEILGRQLLARNEEVADAPYRYGGEAYDPLLADLAQRLGWAV